MSETEATAPPNLEKMPPDIIRKLEEEVATCRQTLAALTASEERNALSVQGAGVGLWDWQVGSEEVYFSPRFKKLLGFADHEMANTFGEFSIRLHPDDTARTLASIQEHLDSDVPFDVEYRLLCKDGEFRWFRATGAAVRDGEGRATRMAGSIKDITREQGVLAALRESEERFALSVEGASDGIWDWNLRTNEIYFSPRWKAMIGWADDELENNFGNYTSRVHPEEQERVATTIKDYLAGKRPVYRVEFRFRHKDGTYRWILARAKALRDGDGQPYRMAGSHSDITDQKEALRALAESEDKLRAAKRAAEEANRAKSDFLANMSHEIRTPMNGIIGMTDILLNTELNDEQRSYQLLVKQSAESLLSILNDILDFSKIEAGKLELYEHDFNLRDAIGDTLQTITVRADEKGLELAYSIQPEIPNALIGDLSRLRQVLINLVGNAIKFTSAGEVVVQVTEDSRTASQVSLHFTVRDTGIGIAPEKQGRIFDSFTQAESSTTRRYGGTGLGLTICRQLVHLMNGRIWVESAAGQGSTFHFTTIFKIGVEAEGDRCQATNLRGLPILVVDDNATNRLILKEMLQNWEMNPVLAEGGAEALEILREREQAPAPEKFRLMILDAMMPGMDGSELAQKVLERYGKDAPRLLLLSSAGHLMEMSETARNGIERILTKPVKQSDLCDAMTRLLGAAARHPAEPAPASSSKPRLRSLHLLLAEDGRVNQMVAIKLLQDRGHKVTLAVNGVEAVHAVTDGQFDAILMDIQMPEMNGYEATAAIRRLESGTDRRTPIIAMTANAMKGDREKCLEAGMDDYLSKPVRALELYEIIEKWGGANEVASAEAALSATPEAAANMVPVFEPEEFRNSIGDDDLMRELIPIFFEDAEGLLPAAEEAIAALDAEKLHQTTHALKGLLGNYSCPAAFQAIIALNQSARENDLTRAGELFQQFKEEVRRLGEALRKFAAEELAAG